MQRELRFGPEKPTIQERFEAFDREHPDVYVLFKRFAFAVKATGRAKFGAKAIMERIRWEYMTTSGSVAGEEFKINDKYTSRYVRKLIGEYPEFNEFFEMRRIRTP